MTESREHSDANEHSEGSQAKQIRSRNGCVLPLFAATIVLALVAFVIRMLVVESTGQDSVAIGKPAPQIDLVKLALNDKPDTLQSLPQNKVVLIHLWGTWCGPCRREYPELNKMVEAFRDRSDFIFLSISCESGPNETFYGLLKKTDAYFESINTNSDAYADAQGVTRQSVVERIERGSLFYPTSILVAKDGTIEGVWEGYAPASVDEIHTMISRSIEH